jgi:hypothetical protein
VQDWITSLIVVGGTLAGTGLGYRGALAINRRDQASALRDRMRSALAEYLGILYASVAELRDVPANKPPNWLDQAINKMRSEQATWLAHRRAEYRLAGDRYREVPARLGTAIAQLQVLPLPPDVRAAVDGANNYVERLSEDRSPERKAEWSEVHAQLMAATRTLGVDGAGKQR